MGISEEHTAISKTQKTEQEAIVAILLKTQIEENGRFIYII